MLFSLQQNKVIQSTRYSCEGFDRKTVEQLLNTKEGIFGFERFIHNSKVENSIIVPEYLKTQFQNIKQKLSFSPDIYSKNTYFYHISLKNSDFLPIFVIHFNCLFDDLYLENNNDHIFIQLLAQQKLNNWKNPMVDQYESYIQGVDSPLKNKFGRLIQERALTFLDKVSNNNSHHEPNEQIEHKIMETGYNCELRLIIQSETPEPTLSLVRASLNHYNHLNKLIISEDEPNDDYINTINNLTFNHSTFHLSASELRSLVFTNKADQHAINSVYAPIEESESTELKSIENHLITDNDLEKAFKQINLIQKKSKLKILSNETGVNMQNITVVIPKDSNFTTLKRRLPDINAALGTKMDIIMGYEPNSVSFICPLSQRQTVYLKPMLQSKEFRNYALNHPLPLFIGVDMMNNNIYESLDESPHLLISGTSGSGKSVFLNTIIDTLTTVKQINELALYIIDPKMVEFTKYKSHPYVKDLITDMQKANGLLKQLTEIMDNRYTTLASMKVKNIKEYNKIAIQPMSYIVVIIDEFADLLSVQKDAETYVQRLGQKARAAGIHLILTTQYPTKDVINGTIKANFPSRISFKLSNNKEYSTVFGTGIPFGDLLGKGDGVMSWVGENEHFIRFQSATDETEETDLKEQLKNKIQSTGECRVKELQKIMGIRINDVSTMMKQLVDEGFLIKTNRGYEIVQD